MTEIRLNLDSKFGRKLVEVFASGVGAVSQPWLTRRNARAEGDAIRLIGQAQADAEKIGRGELTLEDLQANSALIIHENSAASGDVAASARNRLNYQEVKRQFNIESIGQRAIEHAANHNFDDDTISDEEVDPDWIARFFDYAQDISNEEMQQIWAKILAGEIKQPRSFSLLTLDALRNLDQESASKFTIVAKFVWGSAIVNIDNSFDAFFKRKSVTYSDFLLFDELGLVTSQALLNERLESKVPGRFLCTKKYGQHVIKLESSRENPVQIPVYPLKRAGLELLSLLPNTTDYEFLVALCEYLWLEEDLDVEIADTPSGEFMKPEDFFATKD